MKVPEKIPDWLAALPSDALLTTKDMYKMFGYKSGHVMIVSIHNNRVGVQFPDPDYRGRIRKDTTNIIPMSMCRGAALTLRWKASTIRNFIRHVNRKTVNS